MGDGTLEMNRRDFLRTALFTASAAAAPWIIPGRALGKEDVPAPSNTIAVGCIGVGDGIGMSNMQSFLAEKDCRVIAVCDVDRTRLERAKGVVNEHYGNADCATHADFRELIARPDVDALMIALPDHWHAAAAVPALRAGKDVYGEKPIGHTLREGRAIADAAKRYGRIWQTGSWQRSLRDFRYAAELVRNGRIGKVHTIEIGLPVDDTCAKEVPFAPQTPPTHLDYDFWVGPAPYIPYQEKYLHFLWRWNLNFGGGPILDWVGHHVDIAHWGMNWDKTAPVEEVEGRGIFQDKGIYNTAHHFRVEMTYRGGVRCIMAGAEPAIPNGTKWIGSNGWVWVDRGGIDANPKSLLKETFGPSEVHLYRSPGHTREFLDSVRTRREPLAPAETAHRSATPGHLGQIAMLTGRKLRWNPDTEEIIGDETAQRMLGLPMRAPWAV
jgi:predicted dehydrogenase